ncbi:F420-dependent glucose-6-phosphate dehydrogenase [Mycobacterium xenopi 3993]|nr:F420-dependent glucose-6-phosphate dehydrogenase [Mycobacterium xenopi 3993]
MRLMRELWRGTGWTSTATTTTSRARRSTTSPRAGADLRRRGRPGGGQIRRTGRRRVHLHFRQGRGAVPGQADPGRAGGRGGRRSQPRRHRQDDRDQDLLRPDPELALENTRFWAPLSLTAEQKHSIDDPIEMEKAADALPIEQVAKRWIVASDPDEAVEQVRAYLDYGLNHLVFHAPGHDQRRFLRLFETDLAPRLRRLA